MMLLKGSGANVEENRPLTAAAASGLATIPRQQNTNDQPASERIITLILKYADLDEPALLFMGF